MRLLENYLTEDLVTRLGEIDDRIRPTAVAKSFHFPECGFIADLVALRSVFVEELRYREVGPYAVRVIRYAHQDA